jgi:hypothetical protein
MSKRGRPVPESSSLTSSTPQKLPKKQEELFRDGAHSSGEEGDPFHLVEGPFDFGAVCHIVFSRQALLQTVYRRRIHPGVILYYMGRNLLAFVRPGARRTDAQSVARRPAGCAERSKINGPGDTFHR